MSTLCFTGRMRVAAFACLFCAAAIPAIANPPTNDSCATPMAIAGAGTFAFDLTQATTGAEGQRYFCVTQGPPAIDNDVWFCWTADCTGLIHISTCGLTTVDTKISFYTHGCTCPTPAMNPLCCEDDNCGPQQGTPGLQTYITCEVVCGQQYLIQLGTKPGAAVGTGQFSIQCVGTPCPQDSCTNCCGAKPNFAGNTTYAGFPAQVLVATTESNAFSSSPFVLHVIDAQNPQLYTPPQNWFAPFYNHPTWTTANLGTVFSDTLDDLGNIYLCHSSTYGQPGASGWIASDTLGFGGAGAIYKIDTNTALASVFATLPNVLDPVMANCGAFGPPPLPTERWPGLGDICFDCERQRFYVSNFEDGKIYVLNTGGAIMQIYDHGAADNGAPGFAPLGERVWAVKTSQGRLYYSIWDAVGLPNRVWSVAINGAGNIVGAAQLEISYPTSNWVMSPISDIAFSPKCCMLLAERSMYCDTESSAHASRAVEYCYDALSQSWQPSGNPFLVGVFTQINSAGGAAWDFDPNGRVWVSGDALLFGPDINYPLNTQYVYGLQGFPQTGGDTNNSALIDLDQNVAGSDKFQLGDVEVSCPIPGQTPTCLPDTTGTHCVGTCPNGLPCVPVEITLGTDGVYRVTRCDCVDTCHIEMGPVPGGPICVNTCPLPGYSCHIQAVTNADGSITYTCKCDPPPTCSIDPMGQQCVGTCPNGQPCVPVEITRGTDGVYRITRCDCVDTCHIDMGPAGPICVNLCPTPGDQCHIVAVPNADGSVTYSCRCDPPPPCQPDPQGQQCVGTCPNGQPCVPVEITLGTDNVYRVTKCDCVDTCHVEMGPAGPICVNLCPDPTDNCTLRVIPNTDGTTTYKCVCVPNPPPPCQPDPQGQQCAGTCPNGEPCVPTEITLGLDGVYRITKCGCVDECHIEMSGPAPSGPVCVNTCPLPADQCRMIVTANPDGTVTYKCHCEPIPPPVCAPDPQGQTCTGQCPVGAPPCVPTEITLGADGVFRVTKCDCTDFCHVEMGAAGPICVYACPIPGDICRLKSRNNSDGSVSFYCECEPPPPPPCQPDPQGQQCIGTCPNGQPCVPVEITLGLDGVYRVTKCDCVNTCHVEMGPAGPFCVNVCPPQPGVPLVCQLIARANLDGTVTFKCNCLDDTQLPNCDVISVCDIANPGSCYKACSGVCPPGYACFPSEIRENPPHSGVYEIVDCDCYPLVNTPCHPVVQNGLVRCVGSCPGGKPCKVITTYELPTPQAPHGALRYRCECTCVTPPGNMVAWWPLNENPATTAKDLAGFPNTGTPIGGVASVAGCVGNAFQFNGTNGYVNVPHHSSLQMGGGNFSIDAWVKTTQGSGIAPIVDKRTQSVGQVFGFTLFLFNGNLSFQMADGSWFNYISTMNVADGNCHHVAVSVTRNSSTGLVLYVDGIAQTFNPLGITGSINNTAPLTIAKHSLQNDIWWNGVIDEVEIFNRALTSAEVNSVYTAGTLGKCRDGCYVPDLVFCKNQASKAFSISICNFNTFGAFYNWSLAAPVGGVSCGALGATTITPTAGSVFVPAGGCVNIPITMTRPVGLPNTPPICGCYQLTIQNQTTLNNKSCTAKICNSPLLCATKKDKDWDTALHTMRVGAERTVAINVSSMIMNPPPTVLDVQWVVRDAEDKTPDAQAISLNGLPPGTPVIDAIAVPPGGVIMVMVAAKFVEDAPLRAYEITLEADLDGDGAIDPVETFAVRSVVPCVTEITGDIDEDGGVTTADVPMFVRALLGSPDEPYHLVSSDLNCDGHADGEDVKYMVDALLGP